MAGDDELDPDRTAILARRRRFVTLAISGLATSGCRHPNPEPCLSVPVPEANQDAEPTTPDPPSPIVEGPGAPLQNGETRGDETEAETGEALEPTPPEVCLEVAPKPCLEKRPRPHPCLMVID